MGRWELGQFCAAHTGLDVSEVRYQGVAVRTIRSALRYGLTPRWG